MPLNRKFPSDKRQKVIFDNHDPIYIFIDNLGGWNVDTRYLSTELRAWLEESFNELFNRQFPQLYAYQVLQAQHEFYAMHLLHVTVTKDTRSPSIVLAYYDMQMTRSIPGSMRRCIPVDCDTILDDFRGDYSTPSF